MKRHPVIKVIGFVLAIIGGLLFFWLFPLKLISRLAARSGRSAPCPSSLAWLLDNPVRRRYIRLLLDRVGVRPGERVLELGPGVGAFTVDEEFPDPDYLFPFETIRLVEASGFSLEQRLGNFWVYTVNFRRDEPGLLRG